MLHLLYIFFRALIIFYCSTVIFADDLLFDGDGYNAFYIENKLYFIVPYSQNHFYIDLKDLSLENGTIYNAPRISVASPSYVVSKNPFIGGNSNKKLFLIDESTYGLYVDTLNIELNKWETNNSYKGLPNDELSLNRPWVTNETTGISYSFRGDLSTGVVIFDTINFVWINSTSNPQNLFSKETISIYGCIPVLLSSGQNTTGKTPEERTGHTAVLTSDGRVIVYGGENNLSKSAIPYLTILDTSKPPFMWSTPIEENSIGSLYSHTSLWLKII
ncbi:hypothetical protein C2G38_2136433 [Gigaspora rosea]|uniref:Uncharacterized protein n=1 Tax=Gigaspora rosea TaxID=44941 RepID=A0A397W8E9_9GLOM|nr:hypothetical protein C2G38_2136433 [Gigaspora rosea]